MGNISIYSVYTYECNVCNRITRLKSKYDEVKCPFCNGNMNFLCESMQIREDWHKTLNQVLDALSIDMHTLPISQEHAENEEARIMCPKCGGINTVKTTRKAQKLNGEIGENTETCYYRYYCNDCHSGFGSDPAGFASNNGYIESCSDEITSICFSEGGYPDWTIIKFIPGNDSTTIRILYDNDTYNHDDKTSKEIKELLDVNNHNKYDLEDQMGFKYQYWTLKISTEKWHHILDELYNELFIHEWFDEYSDLGTLDGTHWSIDINYSNGQIRSYSGNNSFPPHWNRLIDIFRDLKNDYKGIYN